MKIINIVISDNKIVNIYENDNGDTIHEDYYFNVDSTKGYHPIWEFLSLLFF